MLFYLLTALSLLFLSNDLSRVIVSLMNIIIVLTPLIGMMLGTMYYYNTRDFAELLLAQPIQRKSVFLGQYLGLSLSMTLSFLVGLGIPFIAYGVLISAQIWNFSMLLLVGVLLTMVFTALAFLVASRFENKIKGFGVAIVMWLFLAVIYDGLFLLSMIVFEAYPLENVALGITLFNPIDLSRILIMLKLDISALLGYTGAVFNKFFGTSLGMMVSLGALVLWVWVPLGLFLRVVKHKDF
jgi:Cu-processing system permease protein